MTIWHGHAAQLAQHYFVPSEWYEDFMRSTGIEPDAGVMQAIAEARAKGLAGVVRLPDHEFEVWGPLGGEPLS